MSVSLIHLLLFILTANGAPIIARNLLQSRYDYPLDFTIKLGNQDLFGPSKTWRGLIAAIVFTALVAFVLGYTLVLGAVIAVAAMTGDVLSSFIKRRLQLKPSSMAPFLDQIPEVLLPALVVREQFGLDASSVMLVVCGFVLLELVLSQILYRFGIRKTPY